MRIVISYPALRCIIEFLDADKRLFFTARCPGIRLSERTIPLHVKILNIGKYYLEIDRISAQFFINQQIWFLDKRNVCRKQSRFNLEQKEAIKKFYNHYLGGRSSIFVDHVNFGGSTGNRPENFSFTVNNFSATHGSFESFLPAINPASYPLDNLEISTTDVLSLDYPIIHTARNLTIMTNRETNHEHLRIDKIRNKNVSLRYELIILADSRKIIMDWMLNKREVGTTFTFFEDFQNDVNVALTELYEDLNDFRKSWKDEDNQEDMIRDYPHFFVEIDKASKILVYGVSIEEGTGSCMMFKVVALTGEVEVVD